MAVKTQSEKTKIKRARSWAKNQEAKKLRIAANEAAHQRNIERGTTGKELNKLAAKQAKALDKAMAEEKDDGSE